MKLAVMQPYFFPYIGYFQLMSAVDHWVVFDDIQYIRHGWVNRNRILSSNLEKEWQYIGVPIKKHKQSELIKNIYIDGNLNWRKTVFGKLSYYKKIKAPYFSPVYDILENCLYHDTDSLINLNIFSLNVVAKYIGLNFEYSFASKSKFDYSNIKKSGDWAFQIAMQLKAKKYINPFNGKGLFDENQFQYEGIDLKFLKSNEINYKQSLRKYVSRLSIIDILMFNSISSVQKMLNNYELV